MVGRGGRVKLTEVNPHLVCVLCRGYLIDATTITECLHSFCRSCIILYLETKSYCPICEVQIHKTKPYLNLKLDKTLQDIVYKLVPGLFHSEMRRRQEFYKKYPLHDLHLHPESRGLVIDRLIYSPDDSISLSLEYYDLEREREEWTSVAADACEHASKRSSSRTNIPPATAANGVSTEPQITAGSDEAKHEQDQIQVEQNKKRYLLCPAVVTMVHLKKFVRNKYNLPDTSNVEIIYRRESLPDSYSLMDVAYIYTWKQNEPMKFYYRIHLVKTVRNFPNKEDVVHSEYVKCSDRPMYSVNIKSEKEEKLKVNCFLKPIKHDTKDTKKKEPVKVGSPKNAYRKSEAYSLDEDVDVKKSKCPVPNPVTSKSSPFSTNKNGLTRITSNSSSAADKNNIDSPKTESKQEAHGFQSKFYQDPSRNILPYKSKARSTIPSEHFPTKPYQRPRVSNSNSKNKLANGTNGSLHTSKTSPKSSNTGKNKQTEISPSRNVTLKINIANTTVVRTAEFETPSIHENPVKNGHSPTKSDNKVDEQVKSDVAIQKHSESESQSPPDIVGEKLAKNEPNKPTINTQEPKSHINTSPATERHLIDQLSPDQSKPASIKSQDPNNKSSQKQVTPLKIVVQQTSSPEKCSNKTNINDSNKSDLQKSQDTGISQKNNISEDIKKSIILDKAAEELLSAVGLKPKNDSKEAFKNVNDIKEESSKENVSPEQQKIERKEGSDFSLPGFGIQLPFRSEHDEMSVNLLLSLSNGHTSANHNSTSTDQTTVDKDSSKKTPESDVSKLPFEQKNHLTESTNITDTLGNRNNVVDTTTSLVSDKLQDKEKSHNNLSSNPTQINGFKVPQNNIINKKQSADLNNTQKSNLIASELKTERNTEGINIVNNTTPKLETNTTINNKILSYSRQKKSSEEKLGSEKNDTPSNRKNTEMAQEEKVLKLPTMVSQVSKNNTKNTKDISKTVDLLLMKSLSASKETNATKAVTPEPTNQADVSSSSVSISKINEKCEIDSSTSYGKDEATAKSIAALALTSLTGQTEVTSSGMASPRRPWTDIEEDEQNSKVRMLKRKLNRPGDCDVLVSTATRDDGLSEAKRRKLVTPDVSIELLTRPINERASNKRPQVDHKKFCPDKKLKVNVVESANHDELRISSIDHLAASSVKIEKVAHCRLNFPALSPTLSVRENLGETPSGKCSPEILRPITPKNLVADRCDTPDITIEKMSDKKLSHSPNVLSHSKKNGDASSSESAVKSGVKTDDVVASCSPSAVKPEMKTKPLSSPTSSNAELSTSPVGQKKMPKLIEINAPPRSKSEVLMQDKKTTNNQSQRTGLKMTTVRKEVPIGKQMPFMKRDCNGALDLSPASVAKPRPILPSRAPPQPQFPLPASGPVDMFSAAAFHNIFKQQLQMQSRLLASQANSSMSRDHRKDPELSKRLEDWVRNAVSCGALPPHPLMFGPLSQQQPQQQSPPQRSNGNVSSIP